MGKQKSNRKLKMGKFKSICDLTESDRQKAISELNESDDLECRISSLRDKIKASDWFNPVFEERLDDQYLKRFLRVAKMDEDAAQERLRRMFALQKGTEYPLTVEMNHPGISRIQCPVRLKFHQRMA